MTPLPAPFVKWLKACNERFARFSGSQFSPHELPSGEKVLTAVKRLCLDCRKREVKPRQNYCHICAKNRKRESDRRHARAKRRLDVGKTENSPIGVEALTKAENPLGYTDSKTPILKSSFPTGQETARSVPS
jgi:hypothetical protein